MKYQVLGFSYVDLVTQCVVIILKHMAGVRKILLALVGL